jgi:hypothetical protein
MRLPDGSPGANGKSLLRWNALERRPVLSPRLALAGIVGALCLSGFVALLVVLGGTGPAPARAQQAAVSPSDPFAGHSHGGDLGVQGMTEKQLRAFETSTLGPAHAREHALMRRAMRWEKDNPKATQLAEKRIAAQVAADDAPAGDPADVGQWETAKTNFPIVAIHAAMLPTGKVMFFSYPTYPNRPNNAEAYLWDPTHPDQPPVLKNPPDKANIWCAGQTFLADGELLVFGGNLDYEGSSQTWKGLDRVFTFDPWSETWQEQPHMAHGRWYPTGVRLPDGRVPIFSGLDESGQLVPHSNTNPDVELFTPSDQRGGVGTIAKIGTVGTGDDTERALKPLGNLYPRMVVMADGHDYTAGPDYDQTWVLDDVDAGPTFSWHDIKNMTRSRTWGTTVPLPSGSGGPTKLLALGGTEWSGDPSTTTTELFDIDNAGAGWQPQTGKDNLYGRGHANTVLLPDGSMVEVGGGRGSLDGYESPLHYAEPEKRHIELWDPQTAKWRLGPAQTEARAYHSTALLLPDGRVMSAGDDFNGDPGKIDANTDNDPIEDTAEIFDPPYLFRGPRPTIDSAPAAIGFGGSFGVNTSNTNITKAALAAPAAVTHGVDMNQRMLQLPVQQRTGCVSVTAPAGPNAAPPGWYMLFLLNDQGVPSIAKWVQVQGGAPLTDCGDTAPPPDTVAPTVAIADPTGGTVAGTIHIHATASDDRGVVGVRFAFMNDVGDTTQLGDDTASPYEATWNTTNVPNGQYTIKATARDASGKATTSSAPVTVGNTDVTAPAVSVTAPLAGATVTKVIAVSANAADASGISQVQFKVDDTDIEVPDKTAPYSIQWGSINVDNGPHTLAAIASDKFGNTATASVDVNVQNEDGKPVNALPPKKGNGAPTTELPGNGGGTGGGKTTPGGGGKAPDQIAPTFRKLKLSSTRFRRGKRTTIRFRLSEPARIALTFERKLPGRRSHGRCVKPRKGARSNCTRYVRVSGGLTAQAKAGTNSIAFSGRLSSKRLLAAGSYRLTLLAKDLIGNWSAPISASFKLLAPASSSGERAARAALRAWF